ADRCRFCRIISNCGRRKGKETKTKHRGRGDSEAARQYPTCFKGRAPAGAAKLVASILFRYAPRRDEEEKGRKVNLPDLQLANAAAQEGVSGFRESFSLVMSHPPRHQSTARAIGHLPLAAFGRNRAAAGSRALFFSGMHLPIFADLAPEGPAYSMSALGQKQTCAPQ